MSKTMSAEMEAKVASGSTRNAMMLRLELALGTVLTFTNHDEDIVYDLLGDGDETYVAGVGFSASDIPSRAGLEPGNVEVTFPLSDLITKAGVLGGRFNSARAWLFEVDWSDVGDGHIAALGGEVVEPHVRGNEAVFDIRDWRERLQQTVGRAMLNVCDASHTLPVDPRCGRTPETDTAMVVSAVDGMQMTVTYLLTWTDGYFDKGEVLGLTGANAGVKLKIESFTAAGLIKLFGFLPEVPEAGDTFTLIRGCGKTRPDCMERANMINFRGEPDSPGTDQLMRAPIPGTG